MVEITKEEAMKIREAIPSACITKTCKARRSGKRGGDRERQGERHHERGAEEGRQAHHRRRRILRERHGRAFSATATHFGKRERRRPRDRRAQGRGTTRP